MTPPKRVLVVGESVFERIAAELGATDAWDTYGVVCVPDDRFDEACGIIAQELPATKRMVAITSLDSLTTGQVGSPT